MYPHTFSEKGAKKLLPSKAKSQQIRTCESSEDARMELEHWKCSKQPTRIARTLTMLQVPDSERKANELTHLKRQLSDSGLEQSTHWYFPTNVPGLSRNFGKFQRDKQTARSKAKSQQIAT